MKKRSISVIALAVVLAMLMALSACSGNSEQVRTVQTKAEAEEMVNQFFEPLLSANPVSMTSYSNGESTGILTIDGDKISMKYDAIDDVYYMFILDGVKYIFTESDNVAHDSSETYDMFADAISDNVDMFILSLFDTEEGVDDMISFSATRTDKTVGKTTTSELVLVVTVDTGDDGKGTITVTGTSTDGAVSDYSFSMAENEEEPSIEFEYKFAYDGVSVELPEYTVESSPLIYYSADSPYETLDELIATLDEDESLFYLVEGNMVYAITEYEGRYYQLGAELSDEDRNAYDGLDFLADDYDSQVYDIIGKLAIVDCQDFTDSIIPQAELDVYTGKTVSDLVDAGFECSGWMISEDEAYIYFEKDLLDYCAEITLPDGFDSESDFSAEDLYPSIVGNISFDAPEYAALPMK